MSLAAAKESFGWLNLQFIVHAVAGMAEQTGTACRQQTTVSFAWVRAGSGRNSIIDRRTTIVSNPSYPALARVSRHGQD